MGRTLAANRFALAFREATPRFAAFASCGLPSFVPRALAAFSAALVRSDIASRSCSATAARMWMVSLLAYGLHKALAACKKHKATLVIAKRDRLSRNVAFTASLMDSGVEFQAVDIPNLGGDL